MCLFSSHDRLSSGLYSIHYLWFSFPSHCDFFQLFIFLFLRLYTQCIAHSTTTISNTMGISKHCRPPALVTISHCTFQIIQNTKSHSPNLSRSLAILQVSAVFAFNCKCHPQQSRGLDCINLQAVWPPQQLVQ